MKTNTKTPKFILAAIMAATLAFNASSCKKDSSSTTSTAPTEIDAASFTSDAVTPTTGGMVSQVSDATTIYTTVPVLCGALKDTTITKTSATGATPSYSLNLKWTYGLTCSGIVPATETYNLTGSSSYNGLLFSSNGSCTGTFVLTGLLASASQYSLSSTFSHTGTAVSKVGNKNTFNTTVKLTSSNVAIDKTTQEIASGTSTVAISIVSSSGKTYTYSGTITYLGNKTANLVLNSGTTYPIQW